MNKKWLVSMLGAAAMTVSAGALAQSATTGFYVGAEVGQTSVDSEDDIGFKILGGYRFHPNIAAEVGYGMLFDKDDVEVTAMEFVAVGMFPIANQFSILGKLGLANVEVDTPFGSEDKTELTWGIGVQFDINRNLGVRALFQRYETDESVDVIGIGVTYKF
jgi:opacity protein-like surface antigen